MPCLIIKVSDETNRLNISINRVCSVNSNIVFELIPLLVEEGYLYVTQDDGDILYLGVEEK
jgi:hypothetical protein